MNPKKYAILVAALLATVGPAASLAQTAPEASPDSHKDEIIILNPYTVKSERDYGYRKLSSVTASRIGVSMFESPQAVEIISGELLSDFGFNSIRQAFDYTSSVTANKQEVFQDSTYKLRGFVMPQFINGVAVAPNSSHGGYTSNDNVERVEVAKGPVGLFYGNSSPNGVANFVTKRPENINRTKIELSAGSYNYSKALVDTQAVLSKEHGLSYRLIASINESQTRLDQNSSYNMFAASLSFRPSNKIHIQAEFDSTDYKQGYAAVSTWNYMINPLYFQQAAAPDQTMVNYI
ncbi:MAG: TonB-dependent receptor plug domain-containing protein, partial [Nitrospira sp.]|nr:TonB-dependent receptor plug domain-containing protein [Nitrospira sp.]